MLRRVFIPAALALAAVALLGACKVTDTAGNTGAAAAQASGKPQAGAPTGTTEVHADGVRRVTVDELQKLLADGNTVVYDTRAKTAYDAEHIKGALSMPSNEVGDRTAEFPQGKTLVFYCT
jgi:Rhodanese-like domain